MKKILALLLAVLMLASIGCAWAEGTTEELPEIAFRDVQLGENCGKFKKTVDVLKNETILKGFYPAHEYLTYRIDDIILYWDFNQNNETNNNALLKDVVLFGEIGTYFNYNGGTLVAGYKPSRVDAFFVRPVADGAIVANDDAAIFYAAYYAFNNCDDAMEADLTSKLSSLYGTAGNTTVEQSKNAPGNKYIVWYGANDTEVTLYRSGRTICIVYAWRGAEALIDEALAIAEANQPPAKDVSGDTSGL